jgi:hypothetical protein
LGSLVTPEKIRNLQRKLYLKAKNEPGFRFYALYDKVYRDDILLHAYEVAKANEGAPGVDGVTFKQIESLIDGMRRPIPTQCRYRAAVNSRAPKGPKTQGDWPCGILSRRL